jgi:hypothetical protein
MSSLFLALVIEALFSFQAIASPKSGIEIHWKKDITLSGTYLLSTLVNRTTKTFGWTESIWKSPPVFAEFEIKQWRDKYFFNGDDLHKHVVSFQIDGNKAEGNPCDLTGHNCISRIQVIDSDTFTIRVNDKEENTYYRIDGMTQVGIRGHYFYDPNNANSAFQNVFTPCNAKRALDSAQLTGSESLISSLRKQAQQHNDRVNKGYWDLKLDLYVEGTAKFKDSNQVSDRQYQFAKITQVSETSPTDCALQGDPAAIKLGDFLFPAGDQLGSLPLRRATQAEIDALRGRSDWPTALDHCGANHPSAVFRAYDLSGDGQADFIFSSPCGGEEQWNHIWVHHADSLRYVGAIQGYIRYFFDRRPGAFAVLINRGLCCATSDSAAEVFRFDASTFKLTRAASVLDVFGISLPTEKMQSITFVVAKEGAMLRGDARVDDTPCADDEPCDHPGNIYASVKRGAKGKAFGQRKGNNGETWWFVVFDPAAPLAVNYFPDIAKTATSISGWMNGKDLTMQ